MRDVFKTLDFNGTIGQRGGSKLRRGTGTLAAPCIQARLGDCTVGWQ
jgi:hypothetical protein